MILHPVPTPPPSYASLLDNETLWTILTAFQELHPDLLPVVVFTILDECAVGPLDEGQVRQALRDCYDMTKRQADTQNLYSPGGFVATRLKLCLENQVLVARLAPSTPQVSESPLSLLEHAG